MLVGEAPGKDEDEQGFPFVGRSGKLLDKWIRTYLGKSRDDVYIANVCKCRPPENRNPSWEEMQSCLPFLHQQVQVVQPHVIMTLGSIAAKALSEDKSLAITKIRGSAKRMTVGETETIWLPTYHPAYLLRNGSKDNQEAVKEDFLKAAKILRKLAS